MKEKLMKLIAVFMLFSICGTMGGSYCSVKAEKMIKQAVTNGSISEVVSDYDVKITYEMTGKWDNHYNVNVTLTNLTNEQLEDWEIRIPANFEIENIWNAETQTYEDGQYTIHNAEWNQDIPLNGTVSFGMTVKCEKDLKLPQYADVTRICLGVNKKLYKVELKKYGVWDNHFNGQIVITNNSDKKIEDWSLVMDANFDIDQIWNANVVNADIEDNIYNYDIENAVSNQNIQPHQSVEFGFIASYEKTPQISSAELYNMSADFDLSYEEEDEFGYEEFDMTEDDLELDLDYFDTEEEYQQYLQENGFIEEIAQSDLKTKMAIKAAQKLVSCEGTDLGLESDMRATQNYMPTSNGRYLMQRKGNNAYVEFGRQNSAGKYKYSKQVELKKFAHGQTFEQFFDYAKERKEYYLLAGNAKKGFSRNLAVIERTFFEQTVSKGLGFEYSDWKDGAFRVTKGLAGANGEGKKKGVIYRADAALSNDVLVIWKEIQKRIKRVKRM